VADFVGGTLGPEAVGEVDGRTSAGSGGGESEESAEGQEAFGLVKGEAGAQLAGGGAEDAAAEGGVEGAKAFDFNSEGGLAGGGGDGAAASADGFAGKEELGEDAGKFGLPAGFFFAGELGEVGEGLVDGRVEGAELGEKLVADAVAGVGGVGVGGVFAPRLVLGAEPGFDVAAAGLEEGAEDSAGALIGAAGFVLDLDDGMDGGEAFGPGSAKQLHENGLGLVVEGVGGEDGVGVAGGDEGREEFVADGACGFFESLVVGGSASGDVGVVDVKRDVEGDAEVADEVEVGVGFLCRADAVVDVGRGEAYTEGVTLGVVGGVEGEQEGDGVGPAGDGYADAVAGLDVVSAERESWGCGHAALILSGCTFVEFEWWEWVERNERKS